MNDITVLKVSYLCFDAVDIFANQFFTACGGVATDFLSAFGIHILDYTSGCKS